MKLETFIDKLLAAGFVQSESGATNWYETYDNGVSVFVGIMASEIDCLGCIPIDVIYSHEDDVEETEKVFMTTNGAWKAIKKIVC